MLRVRVIAGFECLDDLEKVIVKGYIWGMGLGVGKGRGSPVWLILRMLFKKTRCGWLAVGG